MMVLVGSGTLWAAACTPALQRIAAEFLHQATEQILNEDEDISFRDWLESELSD